MQGFSSLSSFLCCVEEYQMKRLEFIAISYGLLNASNIQSLSYMHKWVLNFTF